MGSQSLDCCDILLCQRWEGPNDFSRRHPGLNQFEYLFDRNPCSSQSELPAQYAGGLLEMVSQQ